MGERQHQLPRAVIRVTKKGLAFTVGIITGLIGGTCVGGNVLNEYSRQINITEDNASDRYPGTPYHLTTYAPGILKIRKSQNKGISYQDYLDPNLPKLLLEIRKNCGLHNLPYVQSGLLADMYLLTDADYCAEKLLNLPHP